MPGIEKICEMSGEGGSYEMYAFKRSHIQVLPEHRKLFRGAKAELVFTGIEVNTHLWSQSGNLCTVWDGVWDLAHEYNLDVQAWWRDRQYYDDQFLGIEYQYELRVSDQALQGEVKGVYKNWSMDKGAVVRRLKRMIGSGLVVRNECPTSRAAIIKSWKAGKVEEAKALLKRLAEKDAE
jgi:hypothetical protein